MSPEAKRILEVFKHRGVEAGGCLHPTDFGDAIVWKDGFVRDAAVRQALGYLFAEGYLVESPVAFELTEKGHAHIATEPKHGARVYKMGSKLLIKQTVLRGTPAEYVIDGHRERHVQDDDDKAIAGAIRAAVAGEL